MITDKDSVCVLNILASDT